MSRGGVVTIHCNNKNDNSDRYGDGENSEFRNNDPNLLLKESLASGSSSPSTQSVSSSSSSDSLALLRGKNESTPLIASRQL